MSSIDQVSIRECLRAMWDLDATDADWSQSLAAATHPVLASMGAEQGLLVIDFRSRDDGRIDFETRAAVETEVVGDAVVSMVQDAPDYEAMAAFYRSAPWGGTMIEVMERLENREYVFENAGEMGVVDTLGLLGGDARGGTQLQAMSASRIELDQRMRWVVSGLTAHLSAAHRLRQELGSSICADDADAVFDADGLLLHQSTEGEPVLTPLDRLRSSIVAQRGALDTREPQAQCLDTWTSLVDGRYSIIDHFEDAGRRLFLLFENPYFFRSPRALSPMQRDVVALAARGHGNKEIGLALGTSPSSVASHLSAAMSTLGFDRRAELIRYLGWEMDVSVRSAEVSGLRVVELRNEEPNLAVLTEAERDVAKKVADGATNAEVAQQRGTRSRTVANQLARIYSKLGVNSRHELTALLGGLI